MSDQKRALSAEQTIREIKRRTRKLYSAEEKIRIVFRITSYNVCYTKLLRATRPTAIFAGES